MVDQLLVPVRDTAEASAGFAPDGVAAPAEIAKRDVLVRVGGGQGGFPVAVALLALDQCAADQNDAVAVLEFEFVGGGDGEWDQKDRDEKKTAEHGTSPAKPQAAYFALNH